MAKKKKIEVVEEKPRFKLAIATPFYMVTGFSPYIVALINTIRLLTATKIDWEYYEVSGDSYVDRAKNTLANRFMKSDCTHLFMVDSDMYWDVEGFARVLKAAMYGFPVIGAAYPCKNMWNFFGCIPNIDKESGKMLGKEIEGMRLLDMWCIPGGFIMYSREAFKATEPFLDKYYDPNNDIEYVEYFRCNIEDSKTRIGEDVYFQTRYKKAGGIVWLEPNVNIKHMGVSAWEGNYHQFLLNNIGSKEVTPLTVEKGGSSCTKDDLETVCG